MLPAPPVTMATLPANRLFTSYLSRCRSVGDALVDLHHVAFGISNEQQADDAAFRLGVGRRVGVGGPVHELHAPRPGPLGDGIDVIGPEPEVVDADVIQ